MPKPAHQTYSFDEFTLDLTRGSLLRGATEIKLRPKSFEVLTYLVENNRRLIGKNELIEAVWTDAAVTDDSLVQCLKDIRYALNDKSQTFIKTIPRRGYIFEKEVRENDRAVFYAQETTDVHLVIEEMSELAANRLTIRRYRIIVAMIPVVLIALLVAGMFFYKPVSTWWFKPPSIAVLPMVNATGDAGNDYISDGLTESLIRSLTQLNERGKPPRLRVTAQNTVFIFKNKEVEPRTAGRELGVERVLASKMFHQESLRILKFELINVADGSLLWSKQYAASLNYANEFLVRQTEIPADVAAQLPLDLSDADRLNLRRGFTQNPPAYDAYLKGWAESRKFTPSGLKQSIEYYGQALELDANFALAFWAAGVSYRNLGIIDELPDKEAHEKSVEMFQKALKIDNTLTVASNAMRMSEASVWNWKTIEQAGATHPGYDVYLLAAGRIDERLENERRRLSVDPYSPGLNLIHCQTLNIAGRYDEAVAQCRKTLELVPAADRVYVGAESPWIHLALGNAFSRKGMFAEAVAEMKQAIELSENSEAMTAMLGVVYAKAGQKDEAVKILDRLHEQMSRGEYVPALNVAGIYMNLGDREQAFKWLDKAVDEREGRLVNIKVGLDFDVPRDDPRFAELLKRMNLPD